MTFDSGRKLGLVASLIAVIVPAITVILYGFLFLSMLGSLSALFNGGTPAFASPISIYGTTFSLFALGIVGLVGIMLFLLAMYDLSYYYNEQGIFKNILYGFFTLLVGDMAVFAVVFGLTFSTVTSVIPSASTGTTDPLSPAAGIIGILVGIIIVGFVISTVSGIFYRRAFNKLGEKSGVDSFKTAGLLCLIGMTLSVVLIGALIFWIAWIFAASGFFSLKPQTNEPAAVSYAAPQPPVVHSPDEK